MFVLKDEIAAYLQRCQTVRRLSGHTIDAYRADLYQFALHIPEGITPTGAILREGLKRIAEEARYSPATVRRKIASVRAFLRLANEGLALETFAGWKFRI
jgi:site-specific recombinase XerD